MRPGRQTNTRDVSSTGNVRRNAQRYTRRPVFHYYYGFIEVRVCREWYTADDLLLLCKALKHTTIIVLYH